ncbi:MULTISPECIES: molybdate ABC transporter substrate-binding protein [unclassified Cytobacillus]|uniref:molybdate ABC transporter substrate-binding protein n=1 Tax=unclassified Cytobacillus TaxID=2675268 RepID=UPI0013570C65|nr:molybdate ABC transporter substrate-binding protein [Cytobacillus sp. AMY 15.2]KAF0820986.1 Molybdenum ABC transporter, substrate-binding protein ModA [Bacillus sp. ZZV12-4809]MCM3090945.1 molybdate ABC transporter substrate-binding protein [Cytobacillus sp. AMY 15.2]
MKKNSLLFLSSMVLFLLLAGCSNSGQSKNTEEVKQDEAEEKVELTISAAASLQDALSDIKASFEKEHPNVHVNFNFGASGSLQQQISQGAPADLFFSASEDKFDQLVKDGLMEEKNGIDLVGNQLVLVVPKDSAAKIKSFQDLSKADRLSIGTPESVPAGKYSKESLKNMNIWNGLKEKVVYAKDVRQVLTYVETNNVDAGIVYKTDALISDNVDIVDTADENTHGPIIYPLGVIKDTSHPEEAKLFYDFLQNEESMSIFEEYGFKGLK